MALPLSSAPPPRFRRMFKFRSAQTPAAAPSGEPPSIEVLRRRARHRLLGATVLVLAAVVILPLLFDTQPRPIPVDLPIDIPGREGAPPLTLRSAAPADSPTQGANPDAAPDPVVVSPPPSAPAPAVPTVATPPEPPVSPAPVSPSPTTPTSKPGKTSPSSNSEAEAARARALLEGRDPAVSTASSGEMVVQVGAFADRARADQMRDRLLSAGLSADVSSVQLAGGTRYRVRIGPFRTRADADVVAQRVRDLGMLPAVVPR